MSSKKSGTEAHARNTTEMPLGAFLLLFFKHSEIHSSCTRHVVGTIFYLFAKSITEHGGDGEFP